MSEDLPPIKLETELQMEDDLYMLHSNVGVGGKYHIDYIILYLPKIKLKAQGMKMFADKYLKAHEFTYLKEHIVQINNITTQDKKLQLRQSFYRPRHVYMYFQDSANKNSFAHDLYSTNTDSIGGKC